MVSGVGRVLEMYARVLLPICRLRSAAIADRGLRILLAHCPHIRGGNGSITRHQTLLYLAMGWATLMDVCVHLTIYI